MKLIVEALDDDGRRVFAQSRSYQTREGMAVVVGRVIHALADKAPTGAVPLPDERDLPPDHVEALKQLLDCGHNNPYWALQWFSTTSIILTCEKVKRMTPRPNCPGAYVTTMLKTGIMGALHKSAKEHG